MIGRDIKIESPKTLKTSDEKQVIYFNELLSEKKIRNCLERPPSPVQLGMDKIRAKTLFGKYLIDFASSSTFHGLNHMTAPHRHIIERFLAALFIFGALIALIILSLTFWKRYQDNATVIILEDNYRRFLIKAPSIVLCPTESVNNQMFPEVFSKYGLEDTIETRNFFNFIADATYLTFDKTPDFNAIDPSQWLSILNYLKPDIQYETGFVSSSRWIVTERGFCLAFNNDIGQFSTIEYWQNNNWTLLPSKILSMDYLDVRKHIRVESHQVLLHVFDPDDIMDFQEKLYKCPRRALCNGKFAVAEVTSSHQVKELSIRQRKCKFPEDGGLRMWPIYSTNMCRQECKFQNILKICHCFPHFVRPTPGIPTCNATQLRCITKNWEKIGLTNSQAEKRCGCMANCNSARYSESSFSVIELKEGSPLASVITLDVIFPINKYKREQIFGFDDFLVSVGGAAGLFLGASIISFVEIFYFVTLRLYWHIIKKLPTKKKKLNIVH